MTKVSVVIPTIRGKVIFDTVRALVENTTLPFEIIVVDQGAELNDSFFDYFRQQIHVIYIKSDVKGAARARNAGWMVALGDIIAFIDDDAIPNKDWIKHIVEVFLGDAGNIGIVGGRIVPVYERRNLDFHFPQEFDFLLPAFDQGDQVSEYLNGALPASVNMAIRKDHLIKYGGFNENIGTTSGRRRQIFGEDSEIAIRFKKQGLKLWYHPQVVVVHPVALDRQNEQFFIERCFTEGYTKAFLDCYFHQYTITNVIYMLYNEIRRIVAFRFKYTIPAYSKKGRIQIAKGYIYGLLNFAFRNNNSK